MLSHIPRSLAIILTLAGSRVAYADATPLALDVKICSSDIPVALPSKKFPIGCAILDCCPGCPGPGPLEVRLDFAAPTGSEARLSVGGVPKPALSSIKLGGNARWADGGTLLLAPGESSIQGWPSDAKQVPVFTPQVRIADTAVKQLATVGTKGADRPLEATARLSVTQFLGRFSVREYAVRYTIRACSQSSSDSIHLSNNTANDSAIVLLDGRRSTGCVNDEVRRGSASVNEGNVLSNLACSSEVAVFSDDNAVAFREGVTAWTDTLGDTLSLELQPLVREAVTYWVLQGGFAATELRVNTDAMRADQLFNQMNGGIGFNTTAINDATADVDKDNLLNATCDEAAALRSDIGYTAGQLNVYYNGGSVRGWWCGSDTIIVGATADNETLAHELGHALSLADANIVTTNIMSSGGTARDKLTIGQLFRTSVNRISRINKHGLRPGGVTRNCPDEKSDYACPELALDVIPR